MSRICQTDEEVAQRIREITLEEDPNVIFPSGFPKSFRGLYYDMDLESYGVLYDRESMCHELMISDKIDYEESLEYLEYNTFNAYIEPDKYAQPIYIYTID